VDAVAASLAARRARMRSCAAAKSVIMALYGVGKEGKERKLNR
jgi:hypothetical protein